MISALIATISGREHWLERCVNALQILPDTIEVVIEKDHPNWGAAMVAAADKATGDYLWFGSDDMEVQSFGNAIDYVDRGFLPAPRVMFGDLSLQSCGEWKVEQEEGSYYEFPRIPFSSKGLYDDIGMLPIHYADVRYGTKAREKGIETVVCRSYEVIHHMAPEGRLDHFEQERIRAVAEREDRS